MGLFLTLVFCSPSCIADVLHVNVNGLKEPELSQVKNRVSAFNLTGTARLSRRRLKKAVDEAEQEAAMALRPYGYYRAQVSSTLTSSGENSWRLDLEVTPGPPVIITASTVEITGDGAETRELVQWKKNWPLAAGQRLDQDVWEKNKQDALNLAQAGGYLKAEFTRHVIELDLDRNEAKTELLLDTGPRAVIGKVKFDQDIIKPGILELLPRFKEGQAYDSWMLEKFRLDIWRTGYFDEVNVREERRLEENPPRVNLFVTTSERNRNTYQGSLGFGTDTLIRGQVQWNRHLLSSRGDSLDMALGYQQANDEYAFKSTYRLPRRSKAREFWTGSFAVNRENQDFKVKADDQGTDYVHLTSGDVIDYSVKLGKLIVRDRNKGYQQLFETWYAQYLLEKATFSLRDFTIDHQDAMETASDLEQFKAVDSSMSLGVNWDWPVIHGPAFRTTGHHERAWIFTANKIWGSEKSFTQAYISSSWHRMLGRSWKVLLRGEVGYSEADVSKLELNIDDRTVRMSVTDLPNFYRFKAGGSRSVRGYGFEDLSNNGIGSNNMITGSAEVEWEFRQNWSAAAFFDTGNAFNEWDGFRLRKGVGFGVRWYSIAGPIRIDIAQALDLEGHPWRLHFTIGTPLL